MKKLFSIVAMATLMVAGMTSCSNDDDAQSVQSAKSPAAIGIKVNIEGNSLATRGVATMHANALNQITNFQVWAYDDNTNGLYMGDDAATGRTVTNEGTVAAPVWGYTPQQFWPVNPLNFVALTPAADASITGNTTASASNVVTLTTNVTLSTNVEDQKDIMMAEGDDVEKDDDEGNVPLTFKHALSQVVFKGKFNDAGAVTKATIAEISLCNVFKTGVLTFNSQGYFYGSTSSVTVTKPASVSTPANFTLDGSDLEGDTWTFASEGDDPFDLTTSTNATKKNAWFMIPQTPTAWDGNADSNGIPVGTGSYLKLRVKLEKDGVVIKDNTAADAVYLPLTINWERGKKYIYTIEFNGENALTPITFTVDAVDWVDADPQPDLIEY